MCARSDNSEENYVLELKGKWNVHFWCDASDEELEQSLLDNPPALICLPREDLVTFPHTEDVRQILDSVNNAIKVLCEEYLGLEPLFVPRDAVRITDLETVKHFSQNEKCRGFLLKRMMYIPRMDSRLDFLRSIVHEAAHFISFWSFRVITYEENGKMVRDITDDRVGMYRQYSQEFNALNEAVTEKLSVGLQCFMSGDELPLSAEEQSTLGKRTNRYVPFFIMLEKLLEAYARGQSKADLTQKDLSISLLTGDMSFLDKLETRFSGITEKLARLDSDDDEGAALLLEGYGLKQAADLVRKHNLYPP